MNQIIHLRNVEIINREFWNQNGIQYETYYYDSKKWGINHDLLPTSYAFFDYPGKLKEILNFIDQELKTYENTITFIYSEGNMNFSTIRKIK